VNTILLLSSGVTITAAHHYIRATNNPENLKKFLIYLGATIILGLTFLGCQ
jgi:heme/copper-type cytochrome/quinol oxidase subunit 3